MSAHARRVIELRHPVAQGFPVATGRLALWLCLAAMSMLFAAIASAYIARLSMADWSGVPLPRILWFNTAVLVAASAAFARARGAPPWLWPAGLFGVVFLVGQALAWSGLIASGHVVASSPGAGFFYLITALHGLHVLGGVGAWAWAVRVVRAAPGGAVAGEDRAGQAVELSGTYWHFLLLVWIVMLMLMTAAR